MAKRLFHGPASAQAAVCRAPQRFPFGGMAKRSSTCPACRLPPRSQGAFVEVLLVDIDGGELVFGAMLSFFWQPVKNAAAANPHRAMI